jgi:hypothetical protein
MAQVAQAEVPRIDMPEKGQGSVCRRRTAAGMALADKDPERGKAVAPACTGCEREVACNRVLGTAVGYVKCSCSLRRMGLGQMLSR